MNEDVRKMQPRARRGADYNCKHRLLVSAACTLSSVLSLRKFSHFNQCRLSRYLLSLSAAWFPRPFALLRRTAQSFGPLGTQRSRFSWDSYSAEYVMRNRLRWDTAAPRNENECFWFNVHVRVCRLYVYDTLCASRAPWIANNSKGT